MERVIKELFKTYCHRHHATWISEVPKIRDLLNNVVYDSTEFKPYELHFGTLLKILIRESILRIVAPFLKICQNFSNGDLGAKGPFRIQSVIKWN